MPYTWGTVGIIYNTKYVDEADVGGWDLLWNEKYADKILMFSNPRDAFAIAEAVLGYSLNTEDPDELQAAADLLAEQTPVLQQYVMDQIYDLMDNEEAWIAPYYAGDCMLMMSENPDLAFYLPEEETFNAFIDAMCIPTCAEHKYEAELFINFLTSPEISGGNMDYIGYGTPVSAAKEHMDPEMANSPVAYPDEATLARGESLRRPQRRRPAPDGQPLRRGQSPPRPVIQLPAARPQAWCCRGFLFVLSKRNPSDSKEKTALVRVGGGCCLLRLCACRGRSSRRRMALLIAGRALLRLRSRHCRAEARGGQGGGAPDNLPTSTPLQTPRTTPRGRALPARRISLARARQRGRRINVPFCPAKWDTLEKPVRSVAKTSQA